MNPADSPTAEPRSVAPPRRRWPRVLAVLSLVLLLALAALLGLRLFDQERRLQQMAHDLNALEAQADRLDTRQADLNASEQRSATQVAAFAERIAQHDQIVGRLQDQLGAGRGRFQTAAIEQLLLLANDRLQLAHDVGAALVALDEADARLAALREPRLFAVRQALAKEKAALQAVPQPDLTGAALSLSSLLARVPQLPLATQVPARFEAEPEHLTIDDDARWYVRLGFAVREALSNLFKVRRDAGPSPQLLTVEQQGLIVQVLSLKLEAARVALLRNDTASFRDLVESASRWLDTYFRGDDAGVIAVRNGLQRLAPVELNPPLPDISRSLSLLRAFNAGTATP